MPSLLLMASSKLDLNQIWNYRSFIIGSVKREFKAKYNTSLLGRAWTVLSPLSMILVYTIIFSNIMRSKLPGVEGGRPASYGIFICIGILSWGLFSEVFSRSLTVFLDYSSLLKKIAFPRACLPIIVVCSSILNFLISYSLLILVLLLLRIFPGIVIIAVIPVIAVLIIFAASLGMILGIFNVFFRDIGQMSQILLQFWFWLTPIVYSSNVIPVKVRRLISLNPLTPIIESHQQIVLLGSWPAWQQLLFPTSIAIILMFLAFRLYNRNINDIIDEL